MTPYRSRHAALDIPVTSLADFVLARARERGDRAALVEGATGRAITYAQLPELVDRAAASLSRLGVRQRDVCAIFSPNTPEYAIAVLAIARLGAIVTTTCPTYTRGELLKQLEDCRPRVLFTSPALRQTALDAASAAGAEWIFSFGAMAGATPFDDLLAQPGTPPPVFINPMDVVALPYSSGTTGLPKGVMLSHRNLIANILQVDRAGHLRAGDDTLVSFLPFSPTSALAAPPLFALFPGATPVVMPRFDLAQQLDLAERHRATVLHA